MERLIGRHVEEQGPGGLNRGGPPRRPPGGAGIALGERDEALQRPAGREQDGADEERGRVGAGAHELRVAWERANQEAGRAEDEEQGHPALATHRLTLCWRAPTRITSIV